MHSKMTQLDTATLGCSFDYGICNFTNGADGITVGLGTLAWNIFILCEPT